MSLLCQRSWVTCGKDIGQGRLIYVPAIVSTVDFPFLFMSWAVRCFFDRESVSAENLLPGNSGNQAKTMTSFTLSTHHYPTVCVCVSVGFDRAMCDYGSGVWIGLWVHRVWIGLYILTRSTSMSWENPLANKHALKKIPGSESCVQTQKCLAKLPGQNAVLTQRCCLNSDLLNSRGNCHEGYGNNLQQTIYENGNITQTQGPSVNHKQTLRIFVNVPAKQACLARYLAKMYKQICPTALWNTWQVKS